MAKAGGVCVRSGVVGVGVGLVSGVGRSSNAVSSGRLFDEKTRNYWVFSNFRSSGNAVVRKKVGIIGFFRPFGLQDMDLIPCRVWFAEDLEICAIKPCSLRVP